MTIEESDLELYMIMKDNGYVEQHDYEDYFNNEKEVDILMSSDFFSQTSL